MKRAATAARRPRRLLKRPTARELFDWAQALNDPTVGQAMSRFGCRQCDIEDAIDAFDSDENIPGAYLGLGVALQIGSGVHELRGRFRIIEAYYAPDDESLVVKRR